MVCEYIEDVQQACVQLQKYNKIIKFKVEVIINY